MENCRNPIRINEDLKLHPGEILQADRSGYGTTIWHVQHENGQKKRVEIRDKDGEVWEQI